MDSLSLSWLPGHGWDSALPTQLDSERTLVLAFGPGELREASSAIDDLRRAFPESVCVGASSDAPERQGRQAALAVSVTRFDKTRVGMVLDRPSLENIGGTADDALVCGRRMAHALQLEQGLSAVLVFADRRAVNRVALMRGLADVLPEPIALCDGMDGGATRFAGMLESFRAYDMQPADASAWVLAGGTPVAGIAVAVGLYAQPEVRDERARVALESVLTAF